METKVQVVVRIEKSMREEIRYIAERNHTKFSQEVRILLKHALEERERLGLAD